jgi:serine/threonine-protein kinase
MDAQRPSASAGGLDRLFLDFQSALAGRYSIERELGRGGMGIVYLAREVRLDRPVALKLLPPSLSAKPGLRERFLREARMAAKLSHPNIIPIHAVDEVGEYVFFAMAFVEGETLTERIRRRGPLAPSDAARVLREVAWALAYAHGLGVIHRDVKPDNIILETGTGRALVADFGIAAQVSGAAAMDGGAVIGTPEFMSPEQALGEQVDAKSDLYALGVVGYFALSGRLPFTGTKATEVLAKQITEAPRPLASVTDGTPRRLAQTIDKCLAKERDERPESAAALADQMGLALEQRKELPVPLRVFAKRGGRFGGIGSLAYLWALAATTSLMTKAFGAVSIMPVATFLAGLTVVPFGVLISRAARIAKDGFAREDVVAAFRAELDSGVDERAYEFGRGPSHLERVLRWLSAGGLGTAAIAMTIGSGTDWPGGVISTLLAVLGLMIGLPAGGLALARLARRRDLDTELWLNVWRGPIGRLVFGRLRVQQGRAPLSSGFTFRPTELALGMAAERLFDELPKETREQLRDVPDVLRRLEHDAGKMRARLEDLNDALQGAGDRGRLSGQIDGDIKARRDRVVTDLQAERELVQRRLKDAVAALETIRLNLLRLHAGAGSIQSLTTDLTLAREAAKEVELLLEAHREIDEVL